MRNYSQLLNTISNNLQDLSSWIILVINWLNGGTFFFLLGEGTLFLPRWLTVCKFLLVFFKCCVRVCVHACVCVCVCAYIIHCGRRGEWVRVVFVGRRMSLPGGPIVAVYQPREAGNVTLFRHSIFTNVIKLQILRWAHFGLPGWALNPVMVSLGETEEETAQTQRKRRCWEVGKSA